ncbi:MAG: hypothetical protein HKO66_07580 [Saprospiraceae bacterium]|nr:hypothetical protein [Bacteroidia bacterium]NNL92075.1 hypothetical protein [Saprospiraceae bacterium]
MIEPEFYGTWRFETGLSVLLADNTLEPINMDYVLDSNNTYSIRSSVSGMITISLFSNPSLSGNWELEPSLERIKFFVVKDGQILDFQTTYWDIIRLEQDSLFVTATDIDGFILQEQTLIRQ